jgi:hypothetical protein
LNDPREKNCRSKPPTDGIRDFLADSTRDMELMRALSPRLSAADDAAWRQLGTCAHNVAAGAEVRKLLILAACARELEMLAGDRLAGETPGEFLLQCTNGAIEAMGLEIAELQRTNG